MKRSAFFLLLLLPGIIYSQNFETLDNIKLSCTYSLKYQPDSLSNNEIYKEDFLLHIGNEISFFQGHNAYIIDSIIQAGDLSILSDMGSIPRTSFMFRIYKNYPSGMITTTDKIFVDDYKYAEKLPLFTWEIHKDKEEISGYLATKASAYYGGRQWIAWFTPEIPISDGPYKFNGLPGLILKIYDSEQHYIFSIKDISTVKEGEIENKIRFYNNDYLDVSRDDFFKAREEHRRGLHSRLSSLFSQPNPEAIRRAEDNLRRSNNPIELKAD
jgi:GLPGLI family protein